MIRVKRKDIITQGAKVTVFFPQTKFGKAKILGKNGLLFEFFLKLFFKFFRFYFHFF